MCRPWIQQNTVSHSKNYAKRSDLLLKHGVDSVYLFGSRARGEERDDSDYDFYVVRGKIKGLKLCGLIRELEGSLGGSVDVITDGAKMENDLSQNIFRDMRAVY